MKVLIDGGGQGHFYEQNICKETPTPALDIEKGNTSHSTQNEHGPIV